MENSKRFLRTAIGYARYQANESKNIYSVEEQENGIRNYGNLNAFRILEVFKDDKTSGKTFDRSGFQEMLKYIEVNPWKIKFLIVSDVSRISTSADTRKSFKRFLRGKGIKMISLVYSMPKYIEEKPKQAL